MGLNAKKMVIFVAVDCCLLLAGVYWFVTEKMVVNSRRSKSACTLFLREIQGAKATWALERNIRTNAAPTDEDLFGSEKYMSRRPECPHGGIITLGDLDRPAFCSIPLHCLEAGDVYVTGQDGKPIADAKVVFRGALGAYRRTVTDSQGFANFDAGVMDASPRIEVSKSGWRSVVVSGTNPWPARLVLQRK